MQKATIDKDHLENINDIIYDKGEIIYEGNRLRNGSPFKIKIGDGIHKYSELPYQNNTTIFNGGNY